MWPNPDSGKSAETLILLSSSGFKKNGSIIV
jgi:hypothetical protein